MTQNHNKIKILINLSPLKTGGGQNVALNFLYSLKELNFPDVQFYFFVAKNSSAYTYVKNNNFNYNVLPTNPIKRILFEIFLSKRILISKKIDIIYTYFGSGAFTTKIPQVCGSANSNLYFPEVDFLAYYSGISKLKKRFIDTYRIWGLKRAKAVIFENNLMEEQSKKLYYFKKTIFIKPSINPNIKSEELNLVQQNKNVYTCLFLCGWQLNKNVMLIPEIAAEAQKQGVKLQFILTAPKDKSKLHIQFVHKTKKLRVQDQIKIIGTIHKEQLSNLYKEIDFVFLLSKLESFSNNIIEAWYYKKILIVSDELWSRAICNEAALYVNRENPVKIIKHLKLLIEDSKKQQDIIKKGSEEILKYPTITERTTAEINFVKKIYQEIV